MIIIQKLLKVYGFFTQMKDNTTIINFPGNVFLFKYKVKITGKNPDYDNTKISI